MSEVKVEKNTYTVEPLYQWDQNQKLTIYGLSLPSFPEIHYTNVAMERAIVRQATMDAAGVITADVPNSLLQKPYTISAFVCVYQGSTFETLYKIDIPVKARTQPADYTLEDDDEEVYSFNKLENMFTQQLVTHAEASHIAMKADLAQGVATRAAEEAEASAAEATASAKTATGAQTAAQSALTGVQNALNNLPAGDTLIVNDLTTGGTAAALSAEQGKVLGRRPNPNLLDNWYFVDPINQRGQTEYTGGGYTLDRWRATNANTTVAVDGDGVTITGNGATPYLQQPLEFPAQYLGCQITLSVLTKGGALHTATSTLPKTFPTANTLYCNVADVCDVLVTATTLSARLKAASGGSIDVVAAKLELGSVQTLAHQDASGNWVLNETLNKQQELAKCQRYYQLFSSEAARPTSRVDYRPVMRTNPATGTVDIDGVTYFYADANL